MYSSLEVIDLDDHVTVFTHPAGFQHLAEAELRNTLPLLVPAAMEVFEESGALADYVWDTAGPGCPFLYVIEDAIPVNGVSRLGENAGDRLLGAFTLRSLTPIPGSTDFVLAEVEIERPHPQRHHLLFPAQLVDRYGVGTVVWGVFDWVAQITELSTEQLTGSRHPNLIFRLLLALSRGDRDLWQLMLELGESSSSIIGAAELAEAEGYRIATTEGPPMSFRFVEPPSRRTNVDPDSVTGMGGRDVRGIPMDEGAYRALLSILDRVMSTPELIADVQLMDQAGQILRLVTLSAPRRVLAEHSGQPILESTSRDGEIDWSGLEDWLADRRPFTSEQLMILDQGQPVSAQVVAALRRACDDYALLRVETTDGLGRVVEARKLGFNWSVERILSGFDRATGSRVKIRLADLHRVEFLAQPWYR